MNPSNCRACGGPREVLPIATPAARAVIVRIAIRRLGVRRASDFELCPRCVALSILPTAPASVRDALITELQILLR